MRKKWFVALMIGGLVVVMASLLAGADSVRSAAFDAQVNSLRFFEMQQEDPDFFIGPPGLGPVAFPIDNTDANRFLRVEAEIENGDAAADLQVELIATLPDECAPPGAGEQTIWAPRDGDTRSDLLLGDLSRISSLALVESGMAAGEVRTAVRFLFVACSGATNQACPPGTF